MKTCKKYGRVVPKSMFGGLEVAPEGRKIEKKRHREKEEEGRESKLGPRSLKRAQESQKRALQTESRKRGKWDVPVWGPTRPGPEARRILGKIGFA